MHDKEIEAMARAIAGCKPGDPFNDDVDEYYCPSSYLARKALTALIALNPGVRALLNGEAVAVSRELLEGLALEVESAINEACCVRNFKPHPALERRYERDMQDVREARRLLAASPFAKVGGA